MCCFIIHFNDPPAIIGRRRTGKRQNPDVAHYKIMVTKIINKKIHSKIIVMSHRYKESTTRVIH